VERKKNDRKIVPKKGINIPRKIASKKMQIKKGQHGEEGKAEKMLIVDLYRGRKTVLVE